MARKGILVSDTSVQHMTDMQWLFEFYALNERDKTAHETTVQIFKLARRELISLLGLDTVKLLDMPEDGFIPFAWLAGNPESLSFWREQGEKAEASIAAGENKDFDAMSDALLKAAQTGDMSPIIPNSGISDEELLKDPYLHSEEYKRVLENMLTPWDKKSDG